MTKPPAKEPAASRKTARSAKPAAHPPTASAKSPPGKPGAAKAAPGAARAPQAPRKLSRRDLLTDAVARTGMSRGDLRRALDGILGAMNAALAEGRDMDLPPFGRVRPKRVKEARGGEVHVCRIKLDPGGAGAGKDPLAEAGD
jgi:DNA-binding protein HU-alpha